MYSKNGKAEKEVLFAEFATSIKYIAQRLASRLPVNVELGDLIDAGVIGLLDAAQKFDERRGIQFKTYAEYRIRGAMLDELRKNDWLPRSVRKKSNYLEQVYREYEQKLKRPPTPVELAQGLDMDLEDYFTLLREATTGSVVHFEALSKVVEAGTGWEERLYRLVQATEKNDPFLTAQLHDMTECVARQIEKLPEKERLVITLYYHEELTMKEVGVILGVSESRVSQLRSQAVLRLRAWMKQGT